MRAHTSTPSHAAAIAAYASRVHAAAGGGHHVVSPLGAWLLLALVAPLAGGDDRHELEAALGCDADDARRAAGELLDAEHPSVTAALAVWAHAHDLGATLQAWRDAMPSHAECGPMPSQTEADAWASRHTNGRIDRFRTLDADAVVVLASALATDVRWQDEYGAASSDELGAPWNERVECVLLNHVAGRRAVARTQAAGLVGFHEQRTTDGLHVISVIAPADAAPADAIAAAYELATRLGRGDDEAFVSLFDLPLDGHAWRISEQEVELEKPRPPAEHGTVWLPAWEATSNDLDLMRAGTGFDAAVRTLLLNLPTAPAYRASAAQSARARYDVRGFWAAAVTDMSAVRCAMPRRPEERHRVIDRRIELRFARPFAVVAFASHDAGPRAWRGVPAFGAWVTEPCEPDVEPGVREWLRHERSSSRE